MTVGEEFEKEITDWVAAAAKEALDQGGRKRVEDAIGNWLAFTARKKPVADLAQRIERFRKRIRAMTESISVEVGPRGYVVKAAGDGQDVLRDLERGTDWFDPAGDLTEMITGAIFEQRS